MPTMNNSSRAKRTAAAAAIAAALAAPAEGLRQYYYYDPVGVLTVCYGHTGDVRKDIKYSLEQCKSLLTEDMLKAVNQVEACHPGLPVKVLAAFSDAVFNLGSTVACSKTGSTAARYLYKGDLIAACNELPKWNKGRIAGILVPLGGLTTRRAAERKLCLEGVSE